MRSPILRIPVLHAVQRIALAGALAALAVAVPGAISAGAADHSYEEAIVATRGLVKEAINGSRDRIPDAIRTLENGTGSTQPEILADLRATPPDLQDADIRLAAAEAALNRPGDAGDPAVARQQVHRIIGLPRYDSMRGSRSLWDRFVAWFVQQIAALLFYLVTNADISLQLLFAVVAGLLMIVAIAGFLIVRTNWTRGAGALTLRQDERRAAVRDRFAAADRLARDGDFTEGLHELVAGVAGEVGNRPFWDSSPLTVRELFAGKGLLEELEPLLAPFEASVYGRRRVTPAEFAAALAAASRFRAEQAKEAA